MPRLDVRAILSQAPEDLPEGGRDGERLQAILESLTTMKVCRVFADSPVLKLHCAQNDTQERSWAVSNDSEQTMEQLEELLNIVKARTNARNAFESNITKDRTATLSLWPTQCASSEHTTTSLAMRSSRHLRCTSKWLYCMSPNGHSLY